MAKTYLDQLVEYPAKVIRRICEDKFCIGLLVNKGFDDVTEDDYDSALDENIFDYQYVDSTTETSTAYIWAEIDIPHVSNRQIKGTRLYVTVACHKSFMKLDSKVYKGVIGNRRDNLVRYIDKLLNGMDWLGIGLLSLKSVRTVSASNGFTAREITYEIPDFNIVDLNEV